MSGPRLISEAIPGVTGKVFSRKYIMLGRLVTHWHDIVGADLAGKTQPMKIRYIKPKNGDKATASLDIATSTADATLLHYQKDLILERINQIFGDRWVTAIRFVPMASNAPLKAPRKPPRALSLNEKTYLSGLLDGVSDPEIQERLKNLGSAILQDQKTGL